MIRKNSINRFLRTGLIGLVTASFLAGCNVGSKTENTMANVRFVNLMTDQPTLTIKLDGTAMASDLQYQSLSDYKTMNLDTYSAVVSGATGTTLSTADLALGQVKSTVVFYGNASTMSSLKLTEDSTALTTGKFVVRTLRLASNLVGMDLYVTETGADISGLSPTSYSAASGAAASYSGELTAGAWRVRLTTSGTKNVVFDTTLTFAAGTYNTLALHSLGSAQLPTVLWLQPADGSAKVLANTLARIRVVQATPDVTSSRVTLDDKSIFLSLPYAGVTNYIVTAAGSPTVSYLDQNKSSVFASSVAPLLAGHDYTIYSSGVAVAAKVVIYEENSNDKTSTSGVRGQFVNASSDQAAIDVVANYQPLVSGLSMGKRSAWQNLTASVYPLSYYANTGGTVLVEQSTDELVAGGDYAFALIGTVGAYRAIAYQTN